LNATAPVRHAAFPAEILVQLEAFCAEQRTGKIEIDIRNGQVMVVKATESLFDTNRPKK
jgi:hypothetical protein